MFTCNAHHSMRLNVTGYAPNELLPADILCIPSAWPVFEFDISHGEASHIVALYVLTVLTR